MAERLAAALAIRLELTDFNASSAGTRAVVGHPIHRDVVPVVTNLGGDPTNFAARRLTPKIALDADLVLAMTKAHRDEVLENAPRQLHRTFTLSEAAVLASDYGAQSVSDLAALRPHLRSDETSDIADPVGQSPDFVASIGSRIAVLIPPVLEICRNVASRG